MKRFIFSVAALMVAALSFAQQMPDLPNDPETRIGKLENGMTYYIRHNDKPAQRAEFYLATNVGAIQETPDQDGLAHFLEHMCFNGTKNFPGKSLLNYLESIGASFGGNINASTGVEQTQYMLNNIPLVREGVLDTCLLIMHDYSHFVTCDPEEIDKERGVIIEEKRSRNTASWRMREKASKYFYGDSKYADCTIIGSQENLETFKPESLTNFYHTWYRPDMQALIVVGDIDVDQVEAKIKATFADIPAVENPQPKTMHRIPDNEEPLIGIVTDPENTNYQYQILWKSEPAPEAINSTAQGMMVDLIKSIISSIMSERFSDITSKPGAPFLGAQLAIGKMCETMEVVMGTVSAKEGEAESGLEAYLTEVERMKRYGFNDDEVERTKSDLLSYYESAAKKKDSRKNAEFIRPIMSHFFDNYAFMDPEMEYELAKAILPQIPTAILNQVASQMITKENMVVVYLAPEKEGISHPTEQTIASIITKVQNAEIERGNVEEIPSDFMEGRKIKAGKVKKTAAGIYDTKVLTLSNGVKVILKKTDFEKNRISFTLSKKGGSSIIATEDLAVLDDNIAQLFQNFNGISKFTASTVSKMLSGKTLSVAPFINTYTHGVSGTSTPQDLETALQLANLYITDPRFDQDAYNRAIEQIEAVLPNLMQTPNYKLQSAVYDVLYNNDRTKMISPEVLENASLAKYEKIYRTLLSDVAGATLTVIGDFDEATLVPMICKYIGSLPKGKKATNWQYNGDGIVSGQINHEFRTAMQTPKVTVIQVYSYDNPYSVKDVVAQSALEYILDMVYVETLREEEGGTYGASSSASQSTAPHEFAVLQVSFETNDEQADKLRELAISGLSGLAENGPTEEQFDKTVKNMLKKIPESKISNRFWASCINMNERYGIDYAAEYEAAVNALTIEDVKAAAAAFLTSGNFVELVMRPEM